MIEIEPKQKAEVIKMLKAIVELLEEDQKPTNGRVSGKFVYKKGSGY
jgi:CRISPR/Cas system-associated exonuclease Cas4 (RecB family)